MQKKVLEISFVVVSRFDADPSILSVTAVGKVPSLGWSKPRLVPYQYEEYPEDGYFHFDFIADAPESMAPEIKNLVVAHFDWNPMEKGVKGVVIHSSLDSVQKELDPACIYNLS